MLLFEMLLYWYLTRMWLHEPEVFCWLHVKCLCVSALMLKGRSCLLRASAETRDCAPGCSRWGPEARHLDYGLYWMWSTSQKTAFKLLGEQANYYPWAEIIAFKYPPIDIDDVVPSERGFMFCDFVNFWKDIIVNTCRLKSILDLHVCIVETSTQNSHKIYT